MNAANQSRKSRLSTALIVTSLVLLPMAALGAREILKSHPQTHTLTHAETVAIYGGDAVANRTCSIQAACVDSLPACATYTMAACGEQRSDASSDAPNKDCLTINNLYTCTPGGSNICLYQYTCEWDYGANKCSDIAGVILNPQYAPAICGSVLTNQQNP